MSDKDKILVCIPTMGTTPWQFTSSLLTLQYPVVSNVMWTIRTMIDEARNMFVREAIKNNYSHLLMIDDDESFDSDALIKLYSYDVDVCSAVVFQRSPPHHPCVYKELIDGFHPFYPQEYSEVDAIGTGFVLFKTEVFIKTSSPWFETYYDEKGDHWSVDLDFSKKMKEKGIKMFVDPSFNVTHYGNPVEVNPSFIQEYLKDNNSNLLSPEQIISMQKK